MNTQHTVQSRSHGDGCQNIEKDTSFRFDSKFQTGKTDSSRASFGREDVLKSHSCDRLVYLTTCLIGHQVEVQVLDGSIFSGIFHATNSEDFGVILKMAHLTKDGSQGHKDTSGSSIKLPSRTMIIPAKDLVQVIAKGVPVTRNGFTSDLQHEIQQELMTDSCISQSRHVEAGRELERWVPDESDPGCLELENTFDGPWNRGWDQFEVNETLFGVKSTFDEELYTTKLEKGPRTQELERKAIQIAREIEGEATLDIHLAEERGFQLDGNLEVDEETRYSSVYREVNDDGYDEIEDILLNSRNNETFGGASGSLIGKTLMDMSGRNTDGTLVTQRSSFLVHDQGQLSKAEANKENSDNVKLSPNATAFDPSRASSKGQENTSSSNELSEGAAASSLARPSISTSSTSTCAGRGLSPSSSEKSMLNPHAKEFKLNPNAKSFAPSQTPLRPSSPTAESPFYYPPATHISFAAQQPGIFNPQAAAIQQPYYHPNGPQYGQQQMIMGQPRPVLYMPTYPTH